MLQGGLFRDLDRRLIVAAQQVSHKIDSAALNKPQGVRSGGVMRKSDSSPNPRRDRTRYSILRY